MSDAAWFKFDIPSTGAYESTPFVIVTTTGNQTRYVNQQANGGTWVSLGVHQLSAGDYNAVGVSRWTSSAGYVIADAVKVVARWQKAEG